MSGDNMTNDGTKTTWSEFGVRLHNAMREYGPLCVGIDPHKKLLKEWGYNVDAVGAELFSMRMLQAAQGRASVVKFQTAMFERYGSQGYLALERVLYAAKHMGMITIMDCMHGGLSTTISAFSDAYFAPGAPLRADAITLLPYYGARSLSGIIVDALNNGRGVFIASLTSNEEGVSLQTAVRQTGEYAGKTVAYGIADTAERYNKAAHDEAIQNDKAQPAMGSVGLVIGATINNWLADSDIDFDNFTGPILSPGFGYQGATVEDLKEVFRGTHGNVLVTASREISKHGPDIGSMAAATESIALDVKQALMEVSMED